MTRDQQAFREASGSTVDYHANPRQKSVDHLDRDAYLPTLPVLYPEFHTYFYAYSSSLAYGSL